MRLEIRGGFVEIDPADIALLGGYKWHIHSAGYAAAVKYSREQRKSRTVLMHRLIMGATDPDIHVDHIDRDPLNNRRDNLRFCTHAENLRNCKLRVTNTSGVRGVAKLTGSRISPTQKERWRAKIAINGKHIHLGCFDTKDEAVAARLAAEQKYFGEFAPSFGDR